MRMIRELSAQAMGPGGEPPPVPEVSVKFDTEEHNWVASVPATNTLIGAYDTEAEAQAAGQSYVLNTLGSMLAARGVTPEALVNSGGGAAPQQPPYPMDPQGPGPMDPHGGPGVHMGPGPMGPPPVGPDGAPYPMHPMQGPPDMMMGGYGPGMVDPMDGRGRGSRLGRRAASGVMAAPVAAAVPEPDMDAAGFRQGGGPTGLTAPAPVPPGARGKSQYRGVSWCEKVKKWRALLWDGQKQRFLGHYTTDLDAARAYDRALIELKGPDAKTNFPAASYEGEPPMEDNLPRKQNSSQFKGGCAGGGYQHGGGAGGGRARW